MRQRKPKLSALLDVLAQERSAVRQGQLGGLADIAARKDQMIAHLSQMRLSQNETAELQAAADRNARLLSAAIAGIRDAQTRLAALAEASRGLNVYNAMGATERVGKQGNQLERKA